METVVGYNEDVKENLVVKPTAWLSTFPVQDIEILILDDETIDHIGPSMDLGFRLSKFSTNRKLIISSDLALLILCDKQERKKFAFHYDGRKVLEGVLDNDPYPLIWIDLSDSDNKEDVLLGIESIKKERLDDLKEFCEKFLQETDIIYPFLPKDKLFNNPPSDYKKRKEEARSMYNELYLTELSIQEEPEDEGKEDKEYEKIKREMQEKIKKKGGKK